MTNTIMMGGTKNDEGKLRWELVPWDAFEEVDRVVWRCSGITEAEEYIGERASITEYDHNLQQSDA